MNFETKICIKVAVILLPFFLAVVRLMQILPSVSATVAQGGQIDGLSKGLSPELKGGNVMIFLGSGGHTGEMLRILGNVNLTDFTRTWVVSSNDTSSLTKAKDYEQDSYLKDSEFGSNYVLLHRARDVGDSLVQSVQNTVKSIISTWTSLRSLPQLPSILILNGPGTSVPLAYMIFGMKYFGLCKTRIIYIESLARVNSLSLSGKLLLPITNRFIVQWEKLFYQYKRAEYYGILV